MKKNFLKFSQNQTINDQARRRRRRRRNKNARRTTTTAATATKNNYYIFTRFERKIRVSPRLTNHDLNFGVERHSSHRHYWVLATICQRQDLSSIGLKIPLHIFLILWVDHRKMTFFLWPHIWFFLSWYEELSSLHLVFVSSFPQIFFKMPATRQIILLFSLKYFPILLLKKITKFFSFQLRFVYLAFIQHFRYILIELIISTHLLTAPVGFPAEEIWLNSTIISIDPQNYLNFWTLHKLHYTSNLKVDFLMFWTFCYLL